MEEVAAVAVAVVAAVAWIAAAFGSDSAFAAVGMVVELHDRHRLLEKTPAAAGAALVGDVWPD